MFSLLLSFQRVISISLLSFIVCGFSASGFSATEQTAKSVAATATETVKAKAEVEVEQTVNINTATAEVEVEQTVNINTATAEMISGHLKGIGLKKAQAIIEWRKTNGKFISAEQLTEVKGIGEKTVLANKERIAL
jgi:competence protein ComEA